MKHNFKVTIILLIMFLITQLIGIAVIQTYQTKTETVFNQTTKTYENITIGNQLPYGMQPPEIEPEISITTIIISFIIAISLVFVLMKIRAVMIIKLWFFGVVTIALAITLNAFFLRLISSSYIIALLIAFPLAFIKIFRQNFYIHNLTELLIYPGIAAIFVPILSIWTIILLFVIISVYDLWAVWRSGLMQKMAKFHINKLKIFPGFFVPYADRRTRQRIKLLKQKYKQKKISKKELGKKRIKISLAILGGGDIIFPIIMAGVVLNSMGLWQALTISAFATLSLIYLFFRGKKGKAYPAMPYISVGCFIALVLIYFASFL